MNAVLIMMIMIISMKLAKIIQKQGLMNIYIYNYYWNSKGRIK